MKNDIQIRCTAEKKFIPKHINPEKYYKVIGYITYIFDFFDKETSIKKKDERFKFIVVNDELGITKIDSMNCKIFPDMDTNESEEKK